MLVWSLSVDALGVPILLAVVRCQLPVGWRILLTGRVEWEEVLE